MLLRDSVADSDPVPCSESESELTVKGKKSSRGASGRAPSGKRARKAGPSAALVATALVMSSSGEQAMAVAEAKLRFALFCDMLLRRWGDSDDVKRFSDRVGSSQSQLARCRVWLLTVLGLSVACPWLVVGLSLVCLWLVLGLSVACPWLVLGLSLVVNCRSACRLDCPG